MERHQEGLHCALVVTAHLNCFTNVSRWEEPSSRNAAFPVYITTKDNSLFDKQSILFHKFYL